MQQKSYSELSPQTSSRTSVLHPSVLTSSLFIRSNIRPGVATIRCTANRIFQLQINKQSPRHIMQQLSPIIRPPTSYHKKSELPLCSFPTFCQYQITLTRLVTYDNGRTWPKVSTVLFSLTAKLLPT